MNEVTTIGLDIAKQVFHAHGADASGAMLFSRRISRAKLISFFASQPRSLSPWKHAADPIIGLGSLLRSVIRSG